MMMMMADDGRPPARDDCDDDGRIRPCARRAIWTMTMAVKNGWLAVATVQLAKACTRPPRRAKMEMMMADDGGARRARRCP